MKRIILTAVLLALAVVLSSCTAVNPPAATEAPAATVTEAPTTTEVPVAEPAETGAPAETEAPAAEQSFLHIMISAHCINSVFCEQVFAGFIFLFLRNCSRENKALEHKGICLKHLFKPFNV